MERKENKCVFCPDAWQHASWQTLFLFNASLFFPEWDIKDQEMLHMALINNCFVDPLQYVWQLFIESDSIFCCCIESLIGL